MAKRFIGGELVSSVAPAGSIQAFAGASVPDGWLLCDGSVKNISEFPALAAALDGTWDSFAHPVDGTPTVGAGQFAVPNMKGLYLSGAGNAGGDARSLGVFQGDKTAKKGLTVTNNTVTSGGMSANASHSHGWDLTPQRPVGGLGVAGGSTYNIPSGWSNGDIKTASVAHTHSITSNVVLNEGDNETRPKTAPVNYIIKY